VLLVLDNCEHLVEYLAPMVADLVRGCPRLSVLATSRMPLGTAAEVVYDVPPMEVPGPDVTGRTRLSPDELANVDAVALFADRARAASSAFRLDEANAAAVAELVTELDGIPLSVELAAARVRVVTPEVMVRRVHELRWLEGRVADAPARHRSMLAPVEWSYQRCTPQEQALWSRLAVFVGGFDLEAAEAVCADESMPAADVLEPVLSLADKSIITADRDHPGRYRMLEPLRHYGVDRARKTGELPRWRDAHLAWYEALTATAWSRWSSHEQPAWLARLRLELPNLRAALDHAVQSPSTSPAALRTVVNLQGYWSCDEALLEARHWADLALAHPTGTPAERARAAAMASGFAAQQLDQEYARLRLAEAAELVADLSSASCADIIGGNIDERKRHAALGADATYASVMHGIAAGLVAIHDEEFDAAVERLLAAAELAGRAQHGSALLPSATLIAGMTRYLQGDLAEATRLCSKSLALSQARDELTVRAASLWILGLTALAAGQTAAAEEHELAALRYATRLGGTTQTALSLEALGWIETARGRGIPAAKLLGAAEAVRRLTRLPIAGTPSVAQRRADGAAEARRLAGPDAYDRAFAEGLALDATAAVTLAEHLARARPDARAAGAEPPIGDWSGPLTPREVDVAELIAEGMSNREIAARLVVSERTVHGHVRSILTKLDAKSRAKIASWYTRRTQPDGNPHRTATM
jgi:non-specific serine/threonine protein kinase